MENKGKLKATFIITSVIGVLLFMIPVKYNGAITILVKILADIIGGVVGDFLPLLACIVFTISSIGAIIALGKPKFITESRALSAAFSCSIVWVIIRVIGTVFAWMTFLGMEGAGFVDMVTNGDAGGLILYDLLSTLFIITCIASFLLPLLTDFGLLEFVGALLTKVMRPVFKVPGRAAVDCITSWIGDGTLGVLLTCNQFEDGYYNAKEAATIATCFSAVSITFCLTVLDEVGLTNMFPVFYLVVCLVGIICAIINPRIPPLSRYKSEYLVEGKAMPDTRPEGYKNSVDYGMDLAIKRVAEHKGFGQYMRNGAKNFMSMWFATLPTVMAIGTIALILANETPIFDWCGIPFRPLFQLLQVPEAEAAASTMIVGFTDMFTPAILIASCESAMTRFIVATISITQVLYLSEMGGLILGSKLPVNFGQMFLIFLERTIISILIVCPLAHLLF